MTNAFKHAYPTGGRGGCIRVSLRPVSGGKLRLAIEDDGVGAQTESGGNGIGSRLIQAFAHQVGGVARVSPRETGGTLVELLFADPLYDPEIIEWASA